MSHAHAYFWGNQFTSCRNFSLHKTVADNADFFSSEAVEMVRRSFYIDDCLKSLPTVREAVALATELPELTQQGGFNLAKWLSNSRELLSSIPDQDRFKNVLSVDLDYNDIPSEKALGVLWTVEADQLGFHVKNLDKSAYKTRSLVHHQLTVRPYRYGSTIHPYRENYFARSLSSEVGSG